jgi:hypothetical protein
MSQALKKINARVKQLQKKYPKKKRVTLQKQAGSEYRSGKLGATKKRTAVKKKSVRRVVKKRAPKKSAPKKRGVVRKRTARKKPVSAVLIVEKGGTRRTRPTRVYQVKRTKKGRYDGTRRIGGMSKSTQTLVVVGGLALAAFLLLNNNRSNNMVYVPTGNINRDSKAQEILNWVSVAGASAAQIASLIKNLNTKSDADIDNAWGDIASNNNPTWLYA